MLEKVCSGVEYESDEAEYILTQSVKDSDNKAFEGWEEFAFSLLQKTARLATDDNERLMYQAADEICGRAINSPYSNWAYESYALIKLEIIKATGGELDVDEYIKETLEFDIIRRIAVNMAIAAGDYARAEKLCLEKLQTNSDELRHEYSSPSEWRYLLFEVYDKSGDIEKKIQTAEDLLFRFDTKYYAILKQLLTEKGVWESEYPSLLDGLENSLPYHKYMEILSKENEVPRLFEEVRKYPSSVFDYGKQLAVRFSSQTYTICLDVIQKQANEADNRIKYKKACALIKKMFDFGGVDETESIITEVKAKFPRRPAMLEELDKTAAWVMKKRK